MARADVTATLLPAAAFYLKLGRFAPARALIAAGVPVALATDVNPGGGFSPSMPFVMTLAAFAMNMTFEEALVGATINGAWSLDLADTVGSLEPGKLADAVFVRGDAIDLIRVGAAIDRRRAQARTDGGGRYAERHDARREAAVRDPRGVPFVGADARRRLGRGAGRRARRVAADDGRGAAAARAPRTTRTAQRLRERRRTLRGAGASSSRR